MRAENESICEVEISLTQNTLSRILYGYGERIIYSISFTYELKRIRLYSKMIAAERLIRGTIILRTQKSILL